MKIAFVFPGQGAQAIGMLNAWNSLPALSALIARADRALGQSPGYAGPALSQIIAEGPTETLGLTVNTQPAMLLAAIVALTAWQEAGGPSGAMVAGHSLGEYSALVAAESLSLEQALPLVRLRAQAMQEAVPVGTGSMAAILGLSDEAVLKVCQEASQGEVVEAVNFNAPAQVVIAGQAVAVARACEAAKAAGAKRALPLAVSAPFHSSLLKPAGERLRIALEVVQLLSPKIPLVNNVDVSIETDPLAIKDALVRQAFSPVRWVEVVQKMKSEGVDTVIEFGPGKVLTGLVSRIEKEIKTYSVFDPTSLATTLEAIRAQ
jgi:[acyl-carrier-protein] S-malonyltransferase